MKNGGKAHGNHKAYVAWAFSAKLQKINTKAFFVKSSIFQQNRRLYVKKWFCLIAVVLFENHFHFGSDTCDYLHCNDAKLVLDENKHSIIMWWFTKQNLMLTDDF